MTRVERFTFQYEATTDFEEAKKAIEAVENRHKDLTAGPCAICPARGVIVRDRKFYDSELITTAVCEYACSGDLITLTKCFESEHRRRKVNPAKHVGTQDLKPEDQEIKKELESIKNLISRIA